MFTTPRVNTGRSKVARAKELILAGKAPKAAAKSVGYASARNLKMAFSRHTGEAYSEWVAAAEVLKPHERRVRQAEPLIEAGLTTLIEIARTVGYKDARGLLKAFRRVHGVTPTQWSRGIRVFRMPGK